MSISSKSLGGQAVHGTSRRRPHLRYYPRHRDLPLLWVRAGLDSERTNATITRLASLALSQNAPLTLVNHPTGQHGFEGRDDNAVTRET